MSGNLNILHIPSWYPNDDQPLQGIFIKEQIAAISKVVRQNHVLFMDRKPTLGPSTIEVKQEASGKEVRSYQALLPKVNAYLFNRWLGKYGQLYKQHFSSIPIDLIHGHGIMGGFAAQRIANEAKMAYVVTLHDTAILKNSFKSWKRKKLALMLRDAAKVICVSNLLEEAVIFNFEGVNTCVIPNLVPAQYFEQELEIKTDDHAFTFGVIGALDSRKRVSKILEAFKLLRSEFPKVHLKIAGDGEEMKEIQNNIRSLDLAENIEIIGWLSRDEVPSFYKSIDCLLSASELETFGLTLIEANAFGKPFISAETGAADEILSNNNGLLCTPFSKENFAECMKNIMLSRASYNAIEIRETARREFHEYRIAQEIANLYNRVL